MKNFCMKNFNMKNCIFGGSFIKKKMADIWNFDESIFGARFIIFDKLWYRSNYCWKYRLSKLLLHFIEYHLDQRSSKHIKIVKNSAMQCFEDRSQKKC